MAIITRTLESKIVLGTILMILQWQKLKALTDLKISIHPIYYFMKDNENKVRLEYFIGCFSKIYFFK